MGDHITSQERLYSSLPLRTSDSIRVIDVLPGRPGEEISLQLRVTRLREKPQYEALSYTWGSNLQNRTIHINNVCPLDVTDNLYAALNRMRWPKKMRTLWADAVCINQVELDERSEQVAKMSSIYESASCVLIWLGETYQEHFRFKFRPEFLWNLLWPPAWRAVYALMKNYPQYIDVAFQNTYPHWHKRGWVMQEYVFAKKILICFGNRCMECHGEMFYLQLRGQRHYKSSSFRHTACYDFAETCHALAQLSKSRQERNTHNSGTSLLQMFRVLGGTRVTDPRDVIFSVHGMLPRSEASLIEVDYSSTIAKVYSQATFASIKNEGGLSILTFVVLHQKYESDLPSWATDFRHHSKQCARSKSVELPICGYLNNMMKPYTSMYSLDASSRYLGIAGFFCDSIAATLQCAELRPRKASGYGGMARQEMTRQESLFILEAVDAVRESLSCSQDKVWSPYEGRFLLKQLLGLREAASKTIPTDNTPTPLHEIQPPFSPIEAAFNRWSENVSWYSDNILERRGGPYIHVGHGPGNWDSCFHACGVWPPVEKHSSTVLIRTTCGLVGFATCVVNKDDIIVIIRGVFNFVVLRRTDHDMYLFKGFAYLHGLMEDSFWSEWKRELHEPQQFVLC